MIVIEVTKIALRSIGANKIRAVLTTLGIIIGITAVIALLSLGQGAQSALLEEVEGLGSNSINIIPGGGFNFDSGPSSFSQLLSSRLDHELEDILNNEVRFREVTAVSPEINTSKTVSYKSREEFGSIYGVRPEYFEVREVQTEQGRKISETDDANLRKITVLGRDIALELFGESDPLGKSIKIDGTNFTVIGITAEKNSELDSRIYVPLNTIATVLVGEKDFNRITVSVADESVIDAAAIKIEDQLRDYYRIADDAEANFSVITSADIVGLASSITSVFTTLITSIAGISLVVGGIGIMNIMLVSVTERTREIGLRKAVGAKQNYILMQFLAESVVLTMLGGIVGTVLGILLGLLIGNLGDIPTVISLEAILLATSVSAFIGIVFGYYPAYRAAKLNPIDALRYE